MKTIKFILFALITSICVVLTSCNSEDDVFNPEPESQLKIIGGSTGGGNPIAIPTGYYEKMLEPYGYVTILNHTEIDAGRYGITWPTSVLQPVNSKFQSLVFNSETQFRAHFKNADRIFVDFNRCTVIATKFYSPYVLSGTASWVEKNIVWGVTNTLLIDIKVHPANQPVSWAISYPIVLLAIPKIANLPSVYTRVESGQQVYTDFPIY